MTATFSYTFDLSPDKKILRFRSETGEEYLLIHELSWTVYGNSILNLIIESNVSKNVLITAELCSKQINPVKNCTLLEENTAILSFQNVNFLTPDPWMCIIHAIPHFQLRDFQDSHNSLPTLMPVQKGMIKKSKLEQLSTDMQNILNTSDLSDVTLSDGVNKILAHKVVLAARSPVFARMFQHPMKENCENCVLISDISEDALRELVSFIYTGIVAIKDTKMARKLYVAADKYAVTDLKNVCSEVLQNVCLDDVLDTLSLANLYEDKVLKQASLNFISKNYSEIKRSKNWESFIQENQVLAVEILSFIIDNKL